MVGGGMVGGGWWVAGARNVGIDTGCMYPFPTAHNIGMGTLHAGVAAVRTCTQYLLLHLRRQRWWWCDWHGRCILRLPLLRSLGGLPTSIVLWLIERATAFLPFEGRLES